MEGLPDWFQYGDEPAFPGAAPPNMPPGAVHTLPNAAIIHGHTQMLQATMLPHQGAQPHQPLTHQHQQLPRAQTIMAHHHVAPRVNVPYASYAAPAAVSHYPYQAAVASDDSHQFQHRQVPPAASAAAAAASSAPPAQQQPPTQNAPPAAPANATVTCLRILHQIERAQAALASPTPAPTIVDALQEAKREVLVVLEIEKNRAEVVQAHPSSNSSAGTRTATDMQRTSNDDEDGTATKRSSIADASGTEDSTEGGVAPSQAPARPCSHNNWDNVRARKGAVTLRCRTCQAQWRVMLQTVRRCPHFDTGRCNKNENCPKLHVHRSKQSLNERVQSFGDQVLHRVPRHVRDDEGAIVTKDTSEEVATDV